MSDQPNAGVNNQKALDAESVDQTKLEKESAKAASEYSSQNQSDQSMAVKVHSPFRDYYDGPAFSISAENETGPFDILPKHHNFITLLTPCDVVIRTVNKGDQKIRISGGIMHVKANRAVVFLDV